MRTCHECKWPNRQHAEWCVSQGYHAVGPHPDAPSAEPKRTRPPEPCPCGIARLDCDYHRPQPHALHGVKMIELFDLSGQVFVTYWADATRVLAEIWT
jgi:hypothetical protein